MARKFSTACWSLAVVTLLSLTACVARPIADSSAAAGVARYVFLVRHAERYFDQGDDPPLTSPGRERAQALAETLRDTGITAIITTELVRAKETAAPLAKLLRIEPEVVPIGDGSPADYFKRTAAAVQRHKNHTVLVVGHITIPRIIQALGGPELPTICETVFSDLFLFVPARGADGLIRLRYGAPEEISPRCRNLPEPERY